MRIAWGLGAFYIDLISILDSVDYIYFTRIKI